MYFAECMIILSFVCLLIGSNTTRSEERCLKAEPQQRRNNFIYKNEAVPIIIEVSNRIVHQLVSNILLIFLEEVLGFENVSLRHFDNYSVVCHVSQRVDIKNFKQGDQAYCPYQSDSPFLPDKGNISVPEALINVDLWVQPEVEIERESDILEAGPLTSPARFGWYVPSDLSFEKAINITTWSIFAQRNTSTIFDVSDLMTELKDKTFNNQTNRYYCDEQEYMPKYNLTCEEGYHIPTQCREEKCALLLTSYPEMTGFVSEHIRELNLFVKVVWLGPHLYDVIESLRNKLKEYKNRSLVVLSWTPSDVILPGQTNYNRIIFPDCEKMKESRKIVGCKYDLIRVEKVMWNQISIGAHYIYESLRQLHFSDEKLSSLLELYLLQKNTSSSIRDISCQWFKNNLADTADKWKPNDFHQNKTKIYLLGMFPVHDSCGFENMNGGAIAVATKSAIEDINKSNFLKDHELEIHPMIEECQGKTSFDRTMLMIYSGIVGPAFSKTLELVCPSKSSLLQKAKQFVTVSYSAGSISYSKRDDNPYFFRTIGETKLFTNVYSQMFHQFGWKHIATITDFGQMYSIQNELTNFAVMERKTGELDLEVLHGVVEDFKQKHARIIILNLIDAAVAAVMCKAYQMDMTAEQGFVWFLPYWLSDDWYKKVETDCTEGELLKVITGSFKVKHQFYADDTFMTSLNITVGDWKKKHSFYKNSSYVGYAYDAVLTFAFAIKEIYKDANTAKLTLSERDEKLRETMKTIQFNGVSGPISFPKGNTSRLGNITVEQWFPSGAKNIGIFIANVSNSGALGGTLHLNKTIISWLTLDGSVPSDGSESFCILNGMEILLNVTCDEAILIVFVASFVLMVLCIGAAVLFAKRSYDKLEVTERYMRSLGLDLLKDSQLIALDSWEIPRDKVVINRKIGEGAFGTVYGGEANIDNQGWKPVAVKTLKIGSNREEKLDFLSEAKMMKRFEHKNIVSLIGVCTKMEPMYTVMELMLYGDLKSFLLARRHLVYDKYVEDSEISNKRLTAMALDVARAMSYLAQNKYVHRDIACRNCLVNSQKVVKLGDFGMTRDMFENNYYKFTRKGMLPVRWMAPESLVDGLFTLSSDVWSYGILLYEIITFGSLPYQGMSNTMVLEHVRSGNTINLPSKIKPQLEGLIKSCLNFEAKNRPNASDIVDFLGNNVRLLSPYLDVPLSASLIEDVDEDLEALQSKLFGRNSSDSSKQDIESSLTCWTTFYTPSTTSADDSLENTEPLIEPLDTTTTSLPPIKVRPLRHTNIQPSQNSFRHYENIDSNKLI